MKIPIDPHMTPLYSEKVVYKSFYGRPASIFVVEGTLVCSSKLQPKSRRVLKRRY